MSALLIYLIVKESRRIRTEAVTGIRKELDLTDMQQTSTGHQR